MQVNKVLNFTYAGNSIVKPVCGINAVPQEGVIHPHEFVFVYQEQDAQERRWQHLTQRLRERLCHYGLEMAVLDNHQEPRQSGIAVVHKDAYLIVQSMAYEGVVGEFNLQHILEFGFAPVLTRQIDLLRTLNGLEYVMKTGY
ncbi:hypothetical protein [Undibacterium sp.]|uniref:kynureninase/PvdN C-terminal domain-containing protein n=1 Tax=Undibacterium sp. TaxID=1914977 RepID=UPI0025E07560|nr:hypothetical protein [Undibacterium sp.]MCX7219778.1 hypothetical protein [Burkholderiales bacterium]